DFDDVVDVVALDLPWHAGERNEVVGDNDDAVGVHGVGESKAEGAAGALAVGAVGVAEHVGRGSGDDGDVDVNFAILDGLEATAMGAQNAHAHHVALGAVVAERTIHAAFDVVNDAGLHQLDDTGLRGEGCTWEPADVLHAHAGGGLQDL